MFHISNKIHSFNYLPPLIIRLYGHLPPITDVIKERRTRFAGHCWRSKDEIISDVLLWTLKHGHTRVGRLCKTYIKQICEDIGCQPEDLSHAMEDRADWKERESGKSVQSARPDDDDEKQITESHKTSQEQF